MFFFNSKYQLKVNPHNRDEHDINNKKVFHSSFYVVLNQWENMFCRPPSSSTDIRIFSRIKGISSRKESWFGGWGSKTAMQGVWRRSKCEKLEKDERCRQLRPYGTIISLIPGEGDGKCRWSLRKIVYSTYFQKQIKLLRIKGFNVSVSFWLGSFSKYCLYHTPGWVPSLNFGGKNVYAFADKEIRAKTLIFRLFLKSEKLG